MESATGAREAVAENNSPALLWRLIRRAEELRFDRPQVGLEVALVALEAIGKLPRAQRRPRLYSFAWAVCGSAFRGVEKYDEAEVALARAAELAPQSDRRACLDVARRLAALRASQRREGEARKLLRGVLWACRHAGGRAYGQDLVQCAAVLIRFFDFQSAATLLCQALPLVPTNGDRFHISAVYNLAECRLSLAASEAELLEARRLLSQARRFVDPDSFVTTRFDWSEARILHRLGKLDESLERFEATRAAVEQQGGAFDRALLLLDVVELQLDRGDVEAARRTALESFPVLQLLRDNVDAYRALRALHRAAADSALDASVVRVVRRAVRHAG